MSRPSLIGRDRGRAALWGAARNSLVLALVFACLAAPPVAAWLVGAGRAPFPADRLVTLALSHAGIALAALVPATLIGIALGIAVTRPGGRDLRPLTDGLVAASQAVPPVVVVALAFPVLGFGPAPTVLALVAYGLMPVLRGVVAALQAVPPPVLESARAMGMSPRQILVEVEWPLARPVAAEAVRVSLVLAIATAAVGALAGAATLGTPIILGLQNQNEVLILQGAAATASLAFLADGLFLALVGLGGRTGAPALDPEA